MQDFAPYLAISARKPEDLQTMIRVQMNFSDLLLEFQIISHDIWIQLPIKWHFGYTRILGGMECHFLRTQ